MKKPMSVCVGMCLSLHSAAGGIEDEVRASADSVSTPVYYVYTLRGGPSWIKGASVREQPGFEKHLAQMLDLHRSGVLVMGGPFLDEAGGGMSILRAASLEEAQRLVAGDPLVESGVLSAEPLRPWLIGLAKTVPAPRSDRTAGGSPNAAEVTQSAADVSNDSAPLAERALTKEVVVSASLDEVWRCWTTSDGIASFFSSESKIELRVGGPYECYFGMAPDTSGKRGTQGCRVLSFVPREMLSFEWNFPPWVPALRSSGAKTHVVLRFQDRGNGKVKIRLDQLGWGEGESWDRGFAYFDQAWGKALLKLTDHLEGKDSSASAP